MARQGLKATAAIVVAFAFLSIGLASAGVATYNPVIISDSPAAPVLLFSSNGSSPGVTLNISHDFSQLNASISASGFSSNTSRVSDKLVLDRGNYTAFPSNIDGFTTSDNSSFFSLSSSANYSGVLYLPNNETAYSYASAPVNETVSPASLFLFGFDTAGVRAQSEEFITATGEFINEISLLLSGNGTFNFSMGSTLYGSQLVRNESIAVNGTNYYNVSLPILFLSGETPYYLNLYNVSGSPVWRSAYQQNSTSLASISSYGNLESFLTVNLTISFYGFNFPLNLSINGSSFSGMYSVSFDPILGSIPGNDTIFYEYGLGTGTTWSVSSCGKNHSSNDRFIEVDGTNGTMAYSVQPVAGYSVFNGNGSTDQASRLQVIPIVFYASNGNPMVGANSTAAKYGNLSASQEFQVPQGGVINHISILLAGSGNVNISIGNSLFGEQLMENTTAKVNGTQWYALSVPAIFFGGSTSYFLNVFTVNGSVQWAYSKASHATEVNTGYSYFYSKGKLNDSLSRVDIFNLTYNNSIQSVNGSEVIFVEYGLPADTVWGVNIFKHESFSLGSLTATAGSLWLAHAYISAAIGETTDSGISMILSNSTASGLQFTGQLDKSTSTGAVIGFSINSPLLIGVTLDPHSYYTGMETLGIYITSTDGSVSIIYSIILNIIFSYSGN
ncbi:MAG: hypothetical protein ACYCT2_05010 [Thermoplasmataceae archaeon]